jgi:SPP1 family predicted phage head-tail adaptor
MPLNRQNYSNFEPKLEDLRHRIAIQKNTPAKSGAGDGSKADHWSTYKVVFAEIIPVSGNENYVAQGIQSSVAYRITCHYFPGVNPQMRILWGTRVFEIYAARNLNEQNKFLVMTCEEIGV